MGPSSEKKRNISGNNSNTSEAQVEDEQIKELLLCLRPIRDGNENEVEKLKLSSSEIKVSDEGGRENSSNDANDTNKSQQSKKRPRPQEDDLKGEKTPMLKKSGNEAEKSVVESLILMSSHKRQKEEQL